MSGVRISRQQYRIGLTIKSAMMLKATERAASNSHDSMLRLSFLLIDLANATELQHIAHLTNLGEGAFKLVVIQDVDS
jgi:hypothetical protein